MFIFFSLQTIFNHDFKYYTINIRIILEEGISPRSGRMEKSGEQVIYLKEPGLLVTEL